MTLIDKEALLEKLSTFHPDYTFNITSFRNFIKAQPEADAVPVIRCKHCIHKSKEHQHCALLEMYVVDEFFCAEGERRKE